MTKIVRITQSSYNKLNQLVQETGFSKQVLIEQALEKLSRERFLKRVNQDYERLKNKPKEWIEELEERAVWENINDDLGDL